MSTGNIPKTIQLEEVLKANWDVAGLDVDADVSWFHTRNEAQDQWSQLGTKIVLSVYNSPNSITNDQQTRECVFVTERLTVDVRLRADNYGQCAAAVETMLQDRQNIEDYIRKVLVLEQFNFSPQPNLETGRASGEKMEVPDEMRLKYEVRFYQVVVVVAP